MTDVNRRHSGVLTCRQTAHFAFMLVEYALPGFYELDQEAPLDQFVRCSQRCDAATYDGDDGAMILGTIKKTIVLCAQEVAQTTGCCDCHFYSLSGFQAVFIPLENPLGFCAFHHQVNVTEQRFIEASQIRCLAKQQ